VAQATAQAQRAAAAVHGKVSTTATTSVWCSCPEALGQGGKDMEEV
jgi:hypothetical protein